MYIIRNITLLYTAILLLFATPCHAGIFSKVHTAALMLGGSQNEVLQQAEHVLGVPIKTESMSDEQLGEFHLRYYTYTDKENIVLVLYKDTFYQLFVEEKKPDDMPFIGHLSQELKGYILTKKGNEVKIKMLGSADAQLSPEMLTTGSLDIAWMKFGNKEYFEARELALRVTQKYPSNAEAFNLLGIIDLREKKLASSIGHFKQALKILEGQSEKRKDYILNNLGSAYLKDEQFNNAHKVFEESIVVASNLNCAGRIGNFLSLIGVDEESEAKKTIEPCESLRQVEETVEHLFDYFEITNDSLKHKALRLLKQ